MVLLQAPLADQPLGPRHGWVSGAQSSARRLSVPAPAGINDLGAAVSSGYLGPRGSPTCQVCRDRTVGPTQHMKAPGPGELSAGRGPASSLGMLGGWTPAAQGTRTAPGKGDILLRTRRGEDPRQGVPLGTPNNLHDEKHLSRDKSRFFLSHTRYRKYNPW